MRAYVEGEVIEVERPEPYVNPVTGVATDPTFRAYLRPSNPRYGADYYDGPLDLAPAVGDVVRQLCSIQAKLSKAGRSWLSVFAVREPAGVSL